MHRDRRRRPLLALVLGAALLAGCGSAEPASGGSDRDAPGDTDAPPPSATPSSTPPAETTHDPAAAAAAFTALEAQFDARLGVHVVEVAGGRTVEHRADERFGYASTHKALSVAALLDSLAPGELDEVVRWTAADLVAHSPVTEAHVDGGLTWREVAAAAVVHSDNTAANLVLDRLGGPAGFQAALRDLGDDVTRSDRTETALNDVGPGEVRDTTTPRALATDLRAQLLDGGLSEEHRDLLLGWMRESTTGTGLVRAGVPAGWDVADKSGGGRYGIRNDLAVVRTPDGQVLFMAILSSRTTADAGYDDALVARAARVATDALGLT